MSGIDLTEVQIAARKVIAERWNMSARNRDVIEDAARIVAAAAPLIEAAVRAQVAREIDTLRVGALRGTRRIPATWTFALQDAARIARGGGGL